MKTLRIWSFLFLFFLTFITKAQEVKGAILEVVTNLPIPYATVSVDNNYTFTNEQGEFNLKTYIYNSNDSILISAIGYKDLKLSIKNLTDRIYLSPSPYELNEVVLLNKKPDINQLIEKVNASFEKNYATRLDKKLVFLRESTLDSIENLGIKLNHSTYPEIDSQFFTSVLKTLPRSSNFFIESLFNLYGAPSNQKVEMIKTFLLRDENNNIDSQIIENKIGTLLEKRLNLGSFFKLKSGVFSKKLETNNFTLETFEDSIPVSKSKKDLYLEQKSHAINRGKNAEKILKNIFLSEESSLDVFKKPNKYDFEIIDITEENNDYIYTVRFMSKRKSGFKGVMQINENDAAVLKIKYSNVSDLKSFSLFGFKFKDNLDSGIQIFKKNEAKTYDLVFSQEKTGSLVSISRPLSLIEKKKNQFFSKKINRVDLDLDISIINIKTVEYFMLDNKPITNKEFKLYTPNYDFKKTRLKKFDPTFWDGYSTLEPNDLIKNFKF